MSIKNFFKGMFTTVGVLMVLLTAAAVIVALVYVKEEGPGIPEKVILEANFEKGIVEYVPGDAVIGMLQERRATVRDTIEAIELASRDSRVLGLVARIGAANMGLGRIQELRDAVSSFRKAGKPAVAYAHTFGEFGPGNGAYYLATAFEQIYIQPSGDVGLTGLMYRSPFVLGALEKLGITPRMDHRGQYKTAMNTFTERGFTEAHRESVVSMMQSHFSQLTKGIAEGRGIPEDEVRAIIDRGPFSAEEALHAKLVDGLAYRDEVYDKMKERAGAEAQFLALNKYGQRVRDEDDSEGETVALIYGVGNVQRGKSGSSPMSDSSMGADTLVAAFRSAIEDKDVRAILFRVDSPGGSYVASDTIWRETTRARKAHKPIVVSMGDLAASGGYFVSAAADKIVAQPGTLTGSIGVFAGKPILSELWEKIGVSWGEAHTSKHAGFWSENQDYSPEEWAQFQGWLDRVYKDFTSKVAEGRKLPLEKVLEIAQGRVWTGEEAKALGLVDALGGFPEALRLAKQEAGISPEAKIRLKLFPRKKKLLESLKEKLWAEEDDDAEDDDISVMMAHALELARPFALFMKDVGSSRGARILTMPEAGAVRDLRE